MIDEFVWAYEKMSTIITSNKAVADGASFIIQTLGETHLSVVTAYALEHYPGLNRELITMAVGALWVRAHVTVEPDANENDPVVRLM